MKIILILLAMLTLPCPFLLTSSAGTANEKSPNLVADISSALINKAVQRSVDQTEPVEETILDTPVQAMGRTQGAIWAELIPSPGCATVDVVFQGCVWARSVGFRPHVLVYTSSVTPLTVRRRIVVSAEGLRTCSAPGCSRSTITTLDVASRKEPDAFAVRFARNAAVANLNLLESETAEKTARQTSNRMAEELSPPLVAVSQSVSRGLTEIKRVGLSVERLNFNTTPTRLQAQMRIAIPGRGEPGPVPTMPADRDLGLAMHESLFNEAAQAVHGGRIISLDEVSKFYDTVTQGLLLDVRKESVQKESLKILEKLIAAVTEKPTTITLAQKDPLRVSFNDQGFTIEVRIASVRQGNTVYAGKLVQAEYRLENSDEGVYVVRQGGVKFLPAGDLSPADKKLKEPAASFLLVEEALFSEILKTRLLLGPLPLPESVSNLRFAAPQASARNGWLTLAWKLKKKEE